MPTLSDALGVLKLVSPAIAAASQFKAIFSAAVAVLNPADQETAKDALQDLIADNDAGFARLDAKLEAAKNR